MAARAAYIAGFDGTATMLAGARFGVPLSGTMAHSFVQVFDDEAEAFEAFAKARPENLVFLIDTYDTEAAARKVVALAPRLRAAGIAIRAVRLITNRIANAALEGYEERRKAEIVEEEAAAEAEGVEPAPMAPLPGEEEVVEEPAEEQEVQA